MLLERGEENPLGGIERPVEEGDVCETETGTGPGVEDENVVLAGGVDDVGVSGYESERSTLSEILRRKRLARKIVSEGVTFHNVSFEIFNLYH